MKVACIQTYMLRGLETSTGSSYIALCTNGAGPIYGKGDKMTNSRFAEENKIFRNACEKSNLPPTKRQASKWRMKKGLAYKGKRKS